MVEEVGYFANEHSEFLSNELNWEYIANIGDFIAKVIDSSTNSATTDCKSLVFLCGNEQEELEVLTGLPENSIWVFLYADETYLPRLNRKVMKIKAVKGIIRPYWNSSQNYSRDWFSCLLRFFLTCKHREKISLIKLAFAGIILVHRQKYIQRLCDKYEKVIIKVPLGYTNGFARYLRQHKKMKCTCVSLVAHSLHENLIERRRDYSVSFVGQIGNIQRQKFVDITEEMVFANNQLLNGTIKVVRRKNFGGTVGSNSATMETFREFIEIGLNSRFGLCPPGNFAGETFRFFEILCLGALPIEASAVISDPAFFRNGSSISRFIIPSIFEIQRIIGMDEKVRRECVQSELKALLDSVKSVNETLSKKNSFHKA